MSGALGDPAPGTRGRSAMSAQDTVERGDAGSARPGDRGAAPRLLGRKSVLMGMLTSGFVIANVAKPSNAAAGTVKPSSIVAAQPTFASMWTSATAYPLGQQVISPNNDVVSANVAHTSSAGYVTDTSKWTLSSSFGPRGSDWAAARAYVVGELVVSTGVIYRATTSHTSASAFDGTKFTA